MQPLDLYDIVIYIMMEANVSLHFVADSGQSTGCSVMGEYHKLLWNIRNSLWASPVSMYQGIHLEKK